MPRKHKPTGRPVGRPRKDGLPAGSVPHKSHMMSADVRKARQLMAAKYREEIVARYVAGASQAEVARQFGVTRQAVCQILKREGVVARPRGGNQGGHSRHRG